MAALRIERCRLTIVEMAITWSASVAWRIPRKNPTASSEMVVPKAGKPAESLFWFRGAEKLLPRPYRVKCRHENHETQLLFLRRTESMNYSKMAFTLRMP
jgi:hypothetical protein